VIDLCALEFSDHTLFFDTSATMTLLLTQLLSFSLTAQAALHHMFVGSYSSNAVYGVTYDDVTHSMKYVKNNTTRQENEWLALSYDGKTLYSSGLAGWSSFPVTSATTIGYESSTTPAVGQCSVWQGVFILASRRAPYSVYGSLSCANYVSVGQNGQLNGAAGQVPYNEGAVIYGMAMDPSNQFLYSSDWKSGKIWTHKVNADGSLTVVNSVDGPSAVSAPRTIVVHPSGLAIYVVLEAWNAIALYKVDPVSKFPIYTGGTFPLLPAGMLCCPHSDIKLTRSGVNAGEYGAQSAVTSAKGSILWAAAYSRTKGKSGYMTGYKLREDGWIEKTLFQVETPTSGGRSNHISSCPSSENLLALSESDKGSVSVWKYANDTATEVANLKIGDASGNKGCCSEAVWLD